MAKTLRDDGYVVHTLYSNLMAQRYDGKFYSMEGPQGPNWLLYQGVRWPCALGNRPIRLPSKRRTIAALRRIVAQLVARGARRVVVYIRSHGFYGGFHDPTGAKMKYIDILNVFLEAHWRGELLLIADCCFSGSIFVHDRAFRNAAPGIRCQIITCGPNTRMRVYATCVSDNPIVLGNRRRRVDSAGLFRHRFMMEVDRMYREGRRSPLSDIVTTIGNSPVMVLTRDHGRDRQLVRLMGCMYRNYGAAHTLVSDWFGPSGEPTHYSNDEEDSEVFENGLVPDMLKWALLAEYLDLQ